MKKQMQTTHGHRLSEEKWHSLEAEEVYKELQSQPEGLDDEEAADRLRFYGPNTLPLKEPPGVWTILLHQVLNPLIFILLAGLPIPLLAVQLLWLNLVTNGIQDVALAFEGGEPGAMKRSPRRPDEKIFDSQMIWQTLVSGVTIGILAFGFWVWLIDVSEIDESSARNSVLLLMVLLQNVHVFNCRSESTSAFKVPINRNVILIFGVAAAQGIHILSMHVPFMQTILGAEPIVFTQWFMTLSLALVVLAVMEGFKWVIRHRQVAV